MIRRTLALLPLVCILAATATAATRAEALAGIDARLVPSGILIDRALPLAGLAAHDGLGQAPPVAPALWRQMLDELTRASLTPPAWPTADVLRREGAAARATGAVPLAVLDCAYERLRPDALERGLLLRRDDRLVSAPEAVPGDLTTTARVFAATALVGRTHRGAVVRFVLERRLYLAEGSRSPEQLALDADDGLGFRALAFDEPLDTVYGIPGTRTLRLRATFASGETLESAFSFDVLALQTPEPDETWAITASIPYQDAVAEGLAYVYLASQHAALTDPVVVVEGFDLDNSMGWPELYALLNQENLLEDLRDLGHDAVVLDFADAGEPMQRNAFVLVELLLQVQTAIAPDRDLVVVGASMGGLVARYALAYMEGAGLAHRARSLVFFDVPHGGANIPLGLQYWVQFFAPESSEAAYLLSRLDTPASRQMLLYHHTDPPGATGQSDPLRASFLADLAALGGWPQTPRLVAVANGSSAGADQGYPPGAQLIRYQYDSFLVDIRGNVWAVPDQSSLRIFQGLIDQIWPLPDRQLNVTVAGTRPWDGAPGGYRASLAQMGETAVPFGQIVPLHANHCFIPTVSALAIDTDDPFFDLAGAPDPLALTPFDAILVPTANEEHVQVTPATRDWLLAEIDRVPTTAPAGPAVLAAASLRPAYPNPANPIVTIDFALPLPGRIHLSVHDAAGRRVATLLSGAMAAGPHQTTWNGRDDRGRPAAAGTYLYVLRTETGVHAGKLTIAR